MNEHDLSGTVIDGRYQVIEPIAEGAMGSVYRGERVNLGRAVAIKIMHQELPDELSSRQRFEREAKLMALLEHPNCVSVIDFGVHDDKPFLVMDLVRGTSLIELIEKSGQIEPAKAAEIIRQVLSGLAHAHELGIVHRDIKPANIMISEKAGHGMQVRILDFGLARLTETSTKLTTGIVVGTPNYMSPEQCKGGDIDARTDLYACGVLLFEMLTGRKPFLADDPISVVRKHLLEPPPTLASVEPRINFGKFEEVVAKALAKKPADRFDSAVEMAKAVEAAAKTTVANLFARAVPESKAPPIGSVQATPSGWAVPTGESSTGQPMPVTDSQFVDPIKPASNESAPAVTESQFIDAIKPPSNESAPPVTQSQFIDAIKPPPTPVDTVVSSPLGGPTSGAPAHVPSSASGPTISSAPPSHMPSAASGPTVGAAVTSNASGPAGTPNQSLAIPPTRPAALPSKLPLPPKQLAMIGGGVVALIVMIAIAASGGGDDKKKPTTTTTSGATTTEPAPDAVAATIERGNRLIAEEDLEAAVSLLAKARKASPDNAQLALTLGRAYFAKLWWSDGVKNFRDAVRLDPSLKNNPEMLKSVLRGFLTTPGVDDRVADFMLELGDPMKAYLEETASTHPNKQLRARAKSELRRYR